MELVGIEPYSPWSGYGMAPALESMRQRLSAQERQQAASAQNAMNMMDYQATRDGWMQQMHSATARMGELSVLANNGTLNSVDRQALQVEFHQMQQSIQSITSGAYATGKHNGLFLFQG